MLLNSYMKKWARLVISVYICLMAGFFGSIFTSPSIPTWYEGLKKPDFSPPNWVFAPVWTSLFVLMGISLYFVWGKGLNKDVKKALFVFLTQLVLNVLWSFLFFGLQTPYYALIEIVMLWFAIAITVFKFFLIDKKAGLLLLPYIIWVTIATFLNYFVWILN